MSIQTTAYGYDPITGKLAAFQVNEGDGYAAVIEDVKAELGTKRVLCLVSKTAEAVQPTENEVA